MKTIRVKVSGKVFDQEEINNAISVAKEGWWTEGKWAKQFEMDFSKYTGVRYVSLVNSGSSANLVALASLTSTIFGERRLKPGDEFITCSSAFPTTVNPGVQHGLTPIFIDADFKTLNIDHTQIEEAITPKTKLIMIAHTLGKPFNLDWILPIVKKYNLWLIEDCCDALGSEYRGQKVGTFGNIATFSFYPAHQITMGEGGAVITNNILINKSIRQFRDWGRDCWCNTGEDDTCKARFSWKMGELPKGYDHKYIYSQIGYNLKLTDFQAAIGVAQLKKLPDFIKRRRENYKELYNFFKEFDCFTVMNENPLENPSYFGFPVYVNTLNFTRNDLTRYLEDNGISTRTIFSGNLLRHPAYLKIKDKIKIHGLHTISDFIMDNAFWIGVYPAITKKETDYIKKVVTAFLKKEN